MKSTGITGKFDGLGRTVIPIELRRKLGNEFEILTEGENVVLRKLTEACEFCGNTEELSSLHGKFICKTCITQLAE